VQVVKSISQGKTVPMSHSPSCVFLLWRLMGSDPIRFEDPRVSIVLLNLLFAEEEVPIVNLLHSHVLLRLHEALLLQELPERELCCDLRHFFVPFAEDSCI